MIQESLRIILKTYSKGFLTEDETIQLIDDLYSKSTSYIPYYWPLYPTYTDGEQKFQKYEITCKTE